MAPVLQCPDCGEKHPLANVPTQGAFACVGCGRVLKVPEVVGQRAASVAAAPEPAPDTADEFAPDAAPAPGPEPRPRPVPIATAVARPTNGSEADVPAADSTRAVPAVDEQAFGRLAGREAFRDRARLGRVPWWMRLLLWFVALPLAFLVVFLAARAFGVFTNNQLSDVFLANDRARFWPIARLLPFVALVTATLVQLGVYGLARLRGRRGTSRPGV